ncbi:hypothetical protein ACWEFL_02655 [Streptomyces sp. NPDC004838]
MSAPATAPTPADELRDAAQTLRQHVAIGAYTATPTGAALLRAREPLAQLLDFTADIASLFSQLADAKGIPVDDPHPDPAVRHALTVARNINRSST